MFGSGKIMTLTDAAAERIKRIVAQRGAASGHIKLGVKARGCSGMSYDLHFVEEKGPQDEVVEEKGVTLLVDPAATLFVIGTEMDYVEDKLQSGFVFNNPNEKGRCGCGESFHV